MTSAVLREDLCLEFLLLSLYRTGKVATISIVLAIQVQLSTALLFSFHLLCPWRIEQSEVAFFFSELAGQIRLSFRFRFIHTNPNYINLRKMA